MNTKTHTTTAGRPGPFTRTEAEEFAASLGNSIMILGIIRENDGWYVSYAQKITTTLLLDEEKGRRMKRYLLFVGDDYEPGGWKDQFQGDFDTIQEASNAIKDMRRMVEYRDWFEIVDADTKKIIEAGRIREKLKEEG